MTTVLTLCIQIAHFLMFAIWPPLTFFHPIHRTHMLRELKMIKIKQALECIETFIFNIHIIMHSYLECIMNIFGLHSLVYMYVKFMG